MNFELVEQEDNPDQELCRFEFFEILCRIAAEKYKDSRKEATTWAAAVKLIIEKNLIPHTETMGGQSFRDNFIWNLPIDDLFRANIEGITKLHNKYSIDMNENLDLQKAIEMVDVL